MPVVHQLSAAINISAITVPLGKKRMNISWWELWLITLFTVITTVAEEFAKLKRKNSTSVFIITRPFQQRLTEQSAFIITADSLFTYECSELII